MVIKNPNRIFFTLYSNKTMNESKEIAKKYLNYKMHVFPDNEIGTSLEIKLLSFLFSCSSSILLIIYKFLILLHYIIYSKYNTILYNV